MNEYIMDPIEQGEARAERWEERFVGDEYKCLCGLTCKQSELETFSPDPYAEPCCPRCFAEAVLQAQLRKLREDIEEWHDVERKKCMLPTSDTARAAHMGCGKGYEDVERRLDAILKGHAPEPETKESDRDRAKAE